MFTYLCDDHGGGEAAELACEQRGLVAVHARQLHRPTAQRALVPVHKRTRVEGREDEPAMRERQTQREKQGGMGRPCLRPGSGRDHSVCQIFRRAGAGMACPYVRGRTKGCGVSTHQTVGQKANLPCPR